ncbi:MAG TPA: radical SAM protein, partial [Clostridiaceae bacterium]|nr:radical SAM protein [Clostridiaceae bacterium]
MISQSKAAAVLNLGCKVNHYETEAIKQQFYEAGFTIVPFDEVADVYVINTCTVTAEAARKSRQMVRRAKRHNEQALVVAVGCDVEMERERLKADIVIGNNKKNEVVKHVLSVLADKAGRTDMRSFAAESVVQTPSEHVRTILADIDTVANFEEMGAVDRQSDTRGVIKIQDGCNNFCSYCAIPLARGRVRSREPEAILNEAKALVAAGFQEIVLTGIHICSYGTDFFSHTNQSIASEICESSAVSEETIPLLDLCDKLAEIDGLRRLRLGSLEPKSVTAAFARRFAVNPILCPHVHLSLQSG